MASYSLMALIRDGSVHKGTTHHLLTIIGTYADAAGAGVSVSIPTLMRVTGLSERSVHYALRRLADSGELDIHTGRGRGHSNGYAINVAALRQNLQRRRAEAAPPPVSPSENLQSLQVVQLMGAQNLQAKPANPASGAGFDAGNLQAASGKPANGDPPSPPTPPVTPGHRANGPGVPAGRPAGRAREDSLFLSEFAGRLQAELGFRCDADRLAPVLADFPELDAAALVAELEAAASKPDRGRPWTLGSWRAWLETGRQHRAARANGHGARVRTAADDVPAELRAKYGPAVERAHV